MLNMATGNQDGRGLVSFDGTIDHAYDIKYIVQKLVVNKN